MRNEISFSEYWVELSEKIEKSRSPSLKDEFFSLLQKGSFLELGIISFIMGIVAVRVLSIFGVMNIFEYLPRLVGLIL